jgi:peptidoglycan/xylan/chitin deacetylase (PgdA/CDA1 family)
MGTLLPSVLAQTLGPVLRWALRSRSAILMFHGFTERMHNGCENIQHKHMHVAKFEAFLDFLTRHYQIVRLNDVIACLTLGKPLPDRSVVLTFDDGFLSNYNLAFPLLKRYRVPAMIYLATEFVDQRRPIWTDRVDHVCHVSGKSLLELREIKSRLKRKPQEALMDSVDALEFEHEVRSFGSDDPNVAAIYRALNWDLIREMQGSGLVEFGAHTHTHKILGRCQSETIQHELLISKNLIEKETGRKCEHFCYPNGSLGDFSEVSEMLVQEAGFKSSLTTISGWVGSKASPFLLPRFGISNDLDVNRLSLILTGVHTAVEKFRERICRRV